MYQFISMRIKILKIVAVIVLYMTILCLVSAVKNAPVYRELDKKSIATSEFSVTAGSAFARIDGTTMLVQAGQGDKVFSARTSLVEGSAFRVEFQVDCPPEMTEGILHIDLYADGYDQDENEFTYKLRGGNGMVSDLLPFGTDHPGVCNLRIFTLDPVSVSISGLRVTRLAPYEGLPPNIIILICLCVLFFCITAGLFFMGIKLELSKSNH